MKKRSHTKSKKKNGITASHPKKRMLTKIKVIGIGGGGGNMVSRMFDGNRVRGVEFIAVNTDAQDLDHVSAHRKIYIGKALTRGLGAGMNPEIGKQAAEENRSEIGEALEGSDIVFLTAGMGGGTGSGGIPVVAEIAREKGILTIAMVTKPFSFEGAQRMNIAQEGIARLKDKVDALVVVPNDRVFSLISKDTPILKAFGYIDDVLKNAVQAIAELINAPGIINIDFADIKSVIRDSGITLIGIGLGTGQERSLKAVESAIHSPLIDVSIEGAKGALFCIAGGRDLKMAEIHDIAKAVSQNLDPNARIIFGAYYDRNMKDKSVKVTVIASGFGNAFGHQRASTSPTLFVNSDLAPRSVPITTDEKKAKASSSGFSEKEKPQKSDAQETDSWEIPTFLRKRKK